MSITTQNLSLCFSLPSSLQASSNPGHLLLQLQLLTYLPPTVTYPLCLEQLPNFYLLSSHQATISLLHALNFVLPEVPTPVCLSPCTSICPSFLLILPYSSFPTHPSLPIPLPFLSSSPAADSPSNHTPKYLRAFTSSISFPLILHLSLPLVAPTTIVLLLQIIFKLETTEIEQWPDTFQFCSQFTESTL